MNKEEAIELFKKYDLLKEDTFKLKVGGRIIPLITRSGIEKIQAKENLYVTHELAHISNDNKYVVIKTTAENKSNGLFVETYGESSPSNTKQSYPVAMAEKRGLSRAVLKITGFYRNGFFGEDEIEGGERLDK